MRVAYRPACSTAILHLRTSSKVELRHRRTVSAKYRGARMHETSSPQCQLNHRAPNHRGQRAWKASTPPPEVIPSSKCEYRGKRTMAGVVRMVAVRYMEPFRISRALRPAKYAKREETVSSCCSLSKLSQTLTFVVKIGFSNIPMPDSIQEAYTSACIRICLSLYRASFVMLSVRYVPR